MRTCTSRTLPILEIVLFVAGLICGGFAQTAPKNAPPSYIADPAAYKLLGENDQFLVVMSKKLAGNRDKWHSHLPNVVYNLTDCHLRIYTPDGKTKELNPKAGSLVFQPAIQSHSAENIGSSECDQLIVERK
jgi:hypothetical protein